MKQLEDLDPSAIDTIEFNIKSVKKYTSIITVLLSICILCVSLFINADSLSELWAPRSSLTVMQYQFKETTQTFTDQPICIAYSPTETFSYLYVYIYSQIDGTNNFTNKTVPEMRNIDGLDYMTKYIGQNKSICYNLKGMLMKRHDQLRIDAVFPPSAIVYVAAQTLNTVKNLQSPEVFILNSSCQAPMIATTVMISTNQFVMQDQLYVNYVPDRFYTIDMPKKLFCQTMFLPLPTSSLQLIFDVDYVVKSDSYIGTSFTFVRSNIADILGNVLAWRGIILIPIGLALILFPIVEKSYKFQLIKARLDSDVINNTNFTLWTDIKRRLSSCFPNKFADERVINKALQKIEDELDLIGILQLQSIMRRQRSEFNQIERAEDIFDCKIQQKDVKIDMLLESSDNLPLQSGTRLSIVGTKNQAIFQRNQEHKSMCITNLLKSLVYYFDNTETTVSISTNQGKGYGSVWSICTFCTFAAVIIACLYFVGVFSMQGSQAIYSSYALDQLDSNITIPAGNLAYRVTHWAYPCVPQVSVVDKNQNIVKNVSMVSNQACLDMVATIGQTSPDWYCNAEDISLSSFDDINTKIEMNPLYSPPIAESNKVGGTMEVVIMPVTLTGQDLAEYHFEMQSLTRSTNSLRKIEQINDDQTTDGYQVDELTREPYDWTAMYVQVGKQYLKTVNQSASYWDIFNSSWGIALIACNLVLFRIGRIVNLRILSSKLNTEKQEKRSDILTVLFDIDRLSKGVYKEELSSVGFYYKFRLPNDST